MLDAQTTTNEAPQDSVIAAFRAAPGLEAGTNQTVTLPGPAAKAEAPWEASQLGSQEPGLAADGPEPSPQQQQVAVAPAAQLLTSPTAVAREAIILFPPSLSEPAQLPDGPLLLAAGPQPVLEAVLNAGGQPPRLPEALPSNSAASSKGKHGGSVYDLLIGEIKALKLQHMAYPRAIADMERWGSWSQGCVQTLSDVIMLPTPTVVLDGCFAAPSAAVSASLTSAWIPCSSNRYESLLSDLQWCQP